MSTTTTLTAGKAPRRWLRFLSLGLGALLLLLVVTYFVVTSSGFFKSVVLPRASKTLNARITVDSAAIHPFSGVALSGLRIETTGQDPLLTAREIRIRYRFAPLLSGRFEADELTVESPVITVRRNADGTSNLDPLLQAPAGSAPKTPATAAPPSAAPPPFALRQFAVRNATVRLELPNPTNPVTALVTNIQVTLDRLEAGQASELAASSELFASLGLTPTNRIHTRASAKASFALGPNLLPTTFKGSGQHEVLEASGTFAAARGFKAAGEGEFANNTLKDLVVRYTRDSQLLAEIRGSGTIDPAKSEASLKVQTSPIDRALLNVAGAAFGLDFGNSHLDASLQLDVTSGGTRFNTSARLNARQVSVRLEGGQPTPPVNLELGLAASVQPDASTLRLGAFTLNGSLGQATLRGSLSEPLVFDWAKGSAGPANAALNLECDNLDFADWKPFLGPQPPQGKLSASLGLAPSPTGLKAVLRGDLPKLSLTQSNLQVRTDIAFEAATVLGGAGALEFTASGSVTNLTISNPQARTAGKPLAATLGLDASWNSNTLTLHQASFRLPTAPAAATNQLNATGSVELGTLPLLAKLRFQAATLDLTPLLDAMPAAPTTATTPTTPAATTAAAQPAQEPAPMSLPLRQVDVELQIARLALREIIASNWNVHCLVESNRFVLDRCALAVGPAPLQADTELRWDVPGWTYRFNLRADRIPVEPWVNSFMPDYRGRYRGDLVAHTSLRGAGMTGPSLRDHFAGQIQFAFTNAEIRLFSEKTKKLITPIATLLRIGDLDRSPLNWLAMDSSITNGKVQLSEVALQSAAFEAHIRGTLAISTNLNATPVNLPVDFLLRRSLAQKSKLLPPDAPTNAEYVPLPPFVALGGTIGDPETKLDKSKISGLLLKSGLGIAEQLGVKTDARTGAALEGLGNLLTGQKAAGSTNAPATNSPAGGLLDLLRRK